MRSRARSSKRLTPLVALMVGITLGSVALGSAPATTSAAAIAPAQRNALTADAAPLPAGFQETSPITGIPYPTAVRFTSDGRVFVALKNGRVLGYNSLSDTSPTNFTDLLTNTHDFWDRGLLGMALSPGLAGGASTGSMYLLYAYNHILGDPAAAPKWGDSCPGSVSNPVGPGPTTDGCVVSGRLSRFNVSGKTITGPEDVLIEDWCQQFPSHSVGSVVFGPDGNLYVSGGDGASFNFPDYGQRGGTLPPGGPYFTEKNPCADPPGTVGSTLTPPTAEGGALRSQDILTSGDPVSLGGAVLRINPTTGAGVSGNPFFGNADANAKRIIAWGLRNPFRITFRPGTDELWVGDVGWGDWEEIQRIPDANDNQAENFGWPCYEGTGHQGGYDALDVNICEDLYDAGPGAVDNAYFAYEHGETVADEACAADGGSSTTGLAFYPSSGGSFNAAFQGGLFFADHSRDCIWFMPKGTNGLPDPDLVQVFREGNNITPAQDINPVDVVIGPAGDLFYVDHGDACATCGAIRRISPTGSNQAPTAVIDADPTSGPVPLQVDFDASDSSDPEGGALNYFWDLDGDGDYDDATGVTASRTYNTPGNVTVRLRVTDPGLVTGTDTQVINVANNPPVPVISTPSAALTWHVGETISFSGSATDTEDGTLAASHLDWSLVINHCPSACHPHSITTDEMDGVLSGSFEAPDHGWPSSLELTLTATDSFGTSASVTRVLQPETVNLTFNTIPAGLLLTLNGASSAAPFTRTMIVGSDSSVTAPSPQAMGGDGWVFGSWSDGGARTHTITAPGSPATYTATFAFNAAAPLTFTPTADSHVRPTKPGKNYGSYTLLRVKLEGARTYLKFVVTGLSGPPTDAKLRLRVTNPSSRGGRIYKVSNSWTEGGITWNNAPAITGSWLSRVLNAPMATWVEFDLGSAITGNGTYSFAIKGGVDDYVNYASRETGLDPQLIILP